MNDSYEKVAWLAVSAAAAIAGRHLARQSLDAGWKAAAGTEAPNEGQLEGDLPKALLWAAATGTIVAMFRILGRRGAEYGWQRVTGRTPPVA